MKFSSRAELWDFEGRTLKGQNTRHYLAPAFRRIWHIRARRYKIGGSPPPFEGASSPPPLRRRCVAFRPTHSARNRFSGPPCRRPRPHGGKQACKTARAKMATVIAHSKHNATHARTHAHTHAHARARARAHTRRRTRARTHAHSRTQKCQHQFNSF